LAAVSPLPTTKLFPPRVPVRAIARPRLHELLSEGTASTLTLISAPPGSGKTTLLAEWTARGQLGGPVCWVGLDEDDNTRARMWRAIVTAVAEGVPALREPGIEAGARTPLDTATLLINRVARHDRPVVLILDDVHSLHERSTLGDIAHLIKHAPPQLRIVLSTRSDPPIPLDRYRLSGQLVEIRAAELAMTVDETRDMLGEVADELAETEIKALCERTEGWAAAIRLAAISLESSEDPHRFIADFAADDRAISDYLLNEVLDQQPEDLRTFLLRTSLPDRLTAELAADLSGRADAGAVLAELARRNLFLHRHGRQAGTYRYHALFRSFLQAELMLERPDEVRDLHRAVASWCVARGSATERIRHAIGAEDWPLTAQAATDAWPQLAFLEPPGTIRKLVDTIPPPVRRRYQTLAVLEAIDLVQRGELEEGSARLSEAATASDPSAESLLTVGRMAVARIDGDMEELERRSRELLERGTTSAAAGQSARRALRATALSQLGTSLLTRGEIDDAEIQLEEAIELAVAEDAHFAYLNSVSQLALLEAVRGRLTRSAELGTEALEFASRHGWGDLLHTIGGHLALGGAHFHWDDLAAAEGHFERAGHAARTAGDRSARAVSALLIANCLAAEGPAGAAKGLRQLRAALGELNGTAVPVYLEGKFRAAVPNLLVERGDVDEAAAILAAETASFVELESLRAKLALAEGDAEAARAATEAGIQLVGPQSCYSAGIEIWLLDGLARRARRERAESRDSLERALELAAPDHYRRVFLGVGPLARAALVELVREGTPHRSFVAELIAAFDRRAPHVAITHSQLLEPLSDREKAILRYLPTMMSNVEIAAELYLSINTVKTHLRHIYRKLGVSRRRDAVERARQLSLL
jgi:LuxR family transcriptional regulator, maltose regulon positive regulatory protein